MIALHGKSTEKWEEASLTLSTTHQALRFYQKFDLVILDEVDAFPYHNNPILYFAVERARKPQGNLIYLSATPPAYLRKIQQIRIPARYHRKPIAIPKIIIEKNLTKSLKNNEPLQVLREIIQYWNEHQRQGFVFVPFIERVDVLVNQLMNYVSVVGTHPRDPMREEKVMQFRRGEAKVIVTTTILERGVTVPRTDVVTFQAEAPIFDEASLVQMSGRVGRSMDDPIGNVVFLASEKTKEMKKAINHIKQMNKLAKEKGMIDK